MQSIRRYLGRKQRSSLLTAACWSRGIRRPPSSDFTKGMPVQDSRGWECYTVKPWFSSDEHYATIINHKVDNQHGCLMLPRTLCPVRRSEEIRTCCVSQVHRS